MASLAAQNRALRNCPVCNVPVPLQSMNDHLDQCLAGNFADDQQDQRSSLMQRNEEREDVIFVPSTPTPPSSPPRPPIATASDAYYWPSSYQNPTIPPTITVNIRALIARRVSSNSSVHSVASTTTHSRTTAKETAFRTRVCHVGPGHNARFRYLGTSFWVFDRVNSARYTCPSRVTRLSHRASPFIPVQH